MTDSDFSTPFRAHRIYGSGLIAWLAAVALVASCSSSGSSGPSRIISGDTTIVRSGEQGQWPGPMTYVEEMSIGELEGEEEMMLGSIGDMVVDANGGIYAFDRSGPVLRYYSAEGEFVRTLGAEGSGPGEYQDMSLGLAVLSDGRLVMRDPRNRRLNFYNPDGTYSDQWEVNSGLYTANALFADRNDHLYLKILFSQPSQGEDWEMGLLHLAPDGAVLDSIPDPMMPGSKDVSNGRLRPRLLWTWSPEGYPVVGFSETYSFEMRLPDGKVIRVERDYDPVPVESGERAQWDAVTEWYREYQNVTEEQPPLPDVKPPYKALDVDSDGRIWVQLYQPAFKDPSVVEREVDQRTPPAAPWREPEVYDVFTADGTYVGRVNVPEKVSLYVFRGDYAWGVRTGDAGEPYIVRMRLEPMQTET